MNYDQLLEITKQRITCLSDNVPQNAFDVAVQLNIRTKNHIECKCDFNEQNYPLKNTDAILAMNNGEYTIYYDENNPYSNFAVAHEIAHYLLNHTSDGAEQHYDAQLLATIIIAPPNKISFKDIKSPVMLADKYRIPIDASELYWTALCEHNGIKQHTQPMIAYIMIFIVLLIISLSTYCIGKFSTNKGNMNIPIKDELIPQHIANISSPTPTMPITTKQTEIITVYATLTGDKYHKATCRHIKKSENLIEFPSTESAIQAGYEPCKDCIQ